MNAHLSALTTVERIALDEDLPIKQMRKSIMALTQAHGLMCESTSVTTATVLKVTDMLMELNEMHHRMRCVKAEKIIANRV